MRIREKNTIRKLGEINVEEQELAEDVVETPQPVAVVPKKKHDEVITTDVDEAIALLEYHVVKAYELIGFLKGN